MRGGEWSVLCTVVIVFMSSNFLRVCRASETSTAWSLVRFKPTWMETGGGQRLRLGNKSRRARAGNGSPVAKATEPAVTGRQRLGSGQDNRAGGHGRAKARLWLRQKSGRAQAGQCSTAAKATACCLGLRASRDRRTKARLRPRQQSRRARARHSASRAACDAVQSRCSGQESQLCTRPTPALFRANLE